MLRIAGVEIARDEKSERLCSRGRTKRRDDGEMTAIDEPAVFAAPEGGKLREDGVDPGDNPRELRLSGILHPRLPADEIDSLVFAQFHALRHSRGASAHQGGGDITG